MFGQGRLGNRRQGFLRQERLMARDRHVGLSLSHGIAPRLPRRAPATVDARAANLLEWIVL